MKNFLFLLLLLISSSCVKTSSFAEVDISTTKKQNVQIGETLVVVPELPAVVDSVSYYWEKQLLQTVREMPFVLHHKIENEAIGSYKMEYYVYHPNGYNRHSLTINVQ